MTVNTEKGLMLQAAFAQLQIEYRYEGRHSEAHKVNTVASKLTEESAERVLWIMLDIMAGRRDEHGKRTMIEAPAPETKAIEGRKAVKAITHQGSAP